MGQLINQEIRKIAPEMDPLRMGMGWKEEDLEKPSILIESTFGDSHPGSAHLFELVEAANAGITSEGGKGQGILPPISVTAWPRATTESIIPWPPGRLSAS